MPDDYQSGITPEMLRKLRHHPAVVQRCTAIAEEMAAQANLASAGYNRPSEKGNPNFGVTLQNTPHTKRARVFVRPLGRTGIHVEQAESVLLKIAGSMGAKGRPNNTSDQPMAVVDTRSKGADGVATHTVNMASLTSDFGAMG